MSTATQLSEVKPPPKTLITKLSEVMGAIDRVPKKGRNAFHGYDYATEADIVEAVRRELAARHVMMVPHIENVEWSELQRKNGTEKLCTLSVRFDLFDGDTGEVLSVPMMGQGSDSGDKAIYKAMTGATKYALLKLFLIPTGDDPETETEAAPSPSPPAQGKRAAEVKAALSARRAQMQSGPPESPPNMEPPPGLEEPEPRETADETLLVPFGRNKGRQLNDPSVPAKDLQYLENAMEESVADPAKARFKSENARLLRAIRAELQRRG